MPVIHASTLIDWVGVSENENQPRNYNGLLFQITLYIFTDKLLNLISIVKQL